MLRTLIAAVVEVCSRRAWQVLVLAGVLLATSLWYCATHFAINTDSSKLFATDLPWRQREMAFDIAFPQTAGLIAIVVDGTTPEVAELAAATLTERLKARSDMFRHVRRPDGGPFFERNALLFLSTAQVARTTEQLIAAQPLLGSLAADPSLRGVLDALSLVLEGVDRARRSSTI